MSAHAIRRAGRSAVIAGALLTACRPADEPLEFSARTFAADSLPECRAASACAEVDLAWPEANGGAPAVATRVNTHVSALLRRSAGDTVARSPGELAAAFQRAFSEANAAPGSRALRNRRWRLQSAVDVPFRSHRHLITLRATTYAYAGGAHGMGQDLFQVVDTRDGRALGVREIIRDSLAALPVVERAFRRAKRLDAGASLAAHGWAFRGDRFTLPENVGLVDSGVVFHWNAYSIGPYVAGSTTLVVPYDSLRPALARGIQP